MLLREPFHSLICRYIALSLSKRFLPFHAPRTQLLGHLPKPSNLCILRIIIQIRLRPTAIDSPEWVALLQQVNDLAILRLQTPLGRLEHAPGRRAEGGEAHDARALGALDVELDVDAAVQLVHLAGNPGDLRLEVDLVAQVLARALVGAQRIEG